MIEVWIGLSPERRALIGQLLRYLITGGIVTLCQAGIYWLLAAPMHIHPQLANVAGYVVAVVLGYFLHGAFTFRGHGSRDAPARRGARFVAVSLLSLALNAFWVWLTVARLGGPIWSPIPLMLFVTPAAVFTLNRQWVFK